MSAEPTIIGLRRFVRVPSPWGSRQEVDDELRFHLESREDDLVAQGWSRAEAHAKALQEFGDRTASRAELLAVDRRRQVKAWVADFAPGVLRDTRSALRQIRKAPALSLVLLLVLAVGVGAGSAVFSITRGFTTRPASGIPYADNEVRLTMVYSKTGEPTPIFRYADYWALEARTDVFAGVGGWVEDYPPSVLISGNGHFALANLHFVTGGYFPTLQLAMTLGQGFGGDARHDTVMTPEIVLSYDYWRKAYDGDPAVVGKTVALNGLPFTIVGVGPEGFNGVDADSKRIDAFVPLSTEHVLVPWTKDNPSTNEQLTVFARVRAGVSRRSAATIASTIIQQRATDRVATELALIKDMNEKQRRTDVITTLDSAREGPTPDHLAVKIGPLSAVSPTDGLTGGLHQESRALAIVAALLLLIVCANASSLLLGSAATRRREIAVRLSLGAPRHRLIRQLLTESVVLAVASVIPASLLAVVLTHAASSRFPSGIDLSPDRATLICALAIALGTGLLVGILPALHATRARLTAALQEGVSGLDRRGSRWQSAFTITQIALAAVFVAVTGVDIGAIVASPPPQFGVRHADVLLSAQLDFTVSGIGPARADSVLSIARARVAAIPGVLAVGSTTGFPLLGQTLYITDNSTTGPDGPSPAVPDTAKPTAVRADPGLFATGALEIRRGRPLEAGDTAGAKPVAVVSEELARQLWPGVDPIGRELVNRTRVPILMYWKTATVVGVAGDVFVDGDSTTPTPMAYLSLHQFPDSADVVLLVRTSGPPARLVDSVRHVLTGVDAKVLVHDVRTFDETKRAALNVWGQLKTIGLATLAALLLACMGVYAVIALRVASRSREIGIRMALGASARQVEARFVWQGLRLSIAGLAVGSGLAYYLVRASGPISGYVLVACALLLLVVIGVAAWLPARRSARVDPAFTLRAE